MNRRYKSLEIYNIYEKKLRKIEYIYVQHIQWVLTVGLRPLVTSAKNNWFQLVIPEIIEVRWKGPKIVASLNEWSDLNTYHSSPGAIGIAADWELGLEYEWTLSTSLHLCFIGLSLEFSTVFLHYFSLVSSKNKHVYKSLCKIVGKITCTFSFLEGELSGYSIRMKHTIPAIFFLETPSLELPCFGLFDWLNSKCSRRNGGFMCAWFRTIIFVVSTRKVLLEPVLFSKKTTKKK